MRLQEALEGVASHAHAALCQAAREHTFVGHVGHNSVLLQHNTKLLLVDLARLSRDLAYQQALLLCGSWRPPAIAAGAAATAAAGAPGGAGSPGAQPSIRVGDAPAVAELLEIGLETRAERGELQGEDEDPVRRRDADVLVDPVCRCSPWA